MKTKVAFITGITGQDGAYLAKHVYGLTESNCIDEMSPPSVHLYYAFSKLASEEALGSAFPDNLVVVRLFNYSGSGQSIQFLNPKLVSHFVKRLKVVWLGKLYPIRDYNDVRNVCSVYKNILVSNRGAMTLNICSGVGMSIAKILTMIEDISGHIMEVRVEPSLVRKGEPRVQVSSVLKLIELGLYSYKFPIQDLLQDLYIQQINYVDR